MASGYTTHNGVSFPIVFLKKKNADGTKFTKDQAVKFFQENGVKPKAAAKAVESLEEKLERAKELAERVSNGEDVHDEIEESEPGEPEVVGEVVPVETSDFLGIKWYLEADARNVVLVTDGHKTFHPTVEDALIKLRKVAEIRMLQKIVPTSNSKKIMDIGTKVRKEFEKLFL